MWNTLMNVDNIDESIEYIDTIHGESKGWITKAEISKQREFSQWHYYVEDLLKQDFDKEDVVPNYDVKVTDGEYKYEYEINAKDGSIITESKELIND